MLLYDSHFLIRGGLYLAACEFLYRIYCRPRGLQEAFRASWKYRIPVWIAVVASVFLLRQIAHANVMRTLHDPLTWILFAMAAVGLACFPSVVLADEAGVEQRRVLRRRTRMAWTDVVVVNQEWEESFLDPWSGGQRTALLSREGTEIRFTEWNAKQDRFEWWMRTHIPPECFGAAPPASITGNWP